LKSGQQDVQQAALDGCSFVFLGSLGKIAKCVQSQRKKQHVHVHQGLKDVEEYTLALK